MNDPHILAALAALVLLLIALFLICACWLLYDIRGKLEQALHDYKITMLSHVQSMTPHRTPDHDRRLIMAEERIKSLEETAGKLL